MGGDNADDDDDAGEHANEGADEVAAVGLPAASKTYVLQCPPSAMPTKLHFELEREMDFVLF